jgi:ubiquinone/menaquinone biosynthesis C-methylase UbiE
VENVVFHRQTAAQLPFKPESMDFGYSLGVLHHVADREGALRAAVRALKPGAPLLIYLYYAFDNRPRWFRALWRLSDVARRLISNASQELVAI